MSNTSTINVENINIAVVDAVQTKLRQTTSKYARITPRRPKKAVYSKYKKLLQTTPSTQNKTEPICSLELGLKQFLNNKINLLSEAWINTFGLSPFWACPFFKVHVIFRESVSRVYWNSKLFVEHCAIVGSIIVFSIIVLTDVSYFEIHWISQTYWWLISRKVFSVAFVPIARVNSFSVPCDILPVTWWKN